MYDGKQKLDSLWADFLVKLNDSGLVDKEGFNTFYSGTKLNALTSNKAIVIVENSFYKTVLNAEKEMLKQQFNEFIGSSAFYEFDFFTEDEINENNSINVEQANKIIIENTINPNFTFENYVVGNSNKEAQAAALGSARNPGLFYNPVFIYGNSGLGKTHLLHAIGNYIKFMNKQLTVYYISSNDFVDQFVKAVSNHKMDEFNEKYQSIDILLVDDVQFLSGKTKTFEVFFHLFNYLINNRKQIVLTSDCHPKYLQRFEERLVSRFSSGLSLSIDKPEFETTLEILKRKIKQFNIDINTVDEDVLNYIAFNFSDDIRKLEGVLNRLLFYAIDLNQYNYINMDLASVALKDFQPASRENSLSVKKIKEKVAEYYNISIEDITSKSRKPKITIARQICIYLVRDLLDLPFQKIGFDFGNRDHSTIISSYNKIDKLLKVDENYYKIIIDLKGLLKNS